MPFFLCSVYTVKLNRHIANNLRQRFCNEQKKSVVSKKEKKEGVAMLLLYHNLVFVVVNGFPGGDF